MFSSKSLFAQTKRILMALLSLTLILSPFLPVPVYAVSSDSLYTYDFVNAQGFIVNQAAANPQVNLTLVGKWTSDETGTTFNGNLINTQSSSYAKPASGNTISVSSNEAVGAAATFVYKAPTTGSCYVDSQNITQIGKYASNTTQVKLQLSKCKSNKTYAECRIAGNQTPNNNYALTGTLVLIDGKTYRHECVKSPDSGSNATVTMRTTLIDPINGDQTSTNTFTIPATGSIQSTNYLSAGNKYPLTTQAGNTDQFTGTLIKLSYCKGENTTNAQSCLASEIPLQTSIPTVTPTPTATPTQTPTPTPSANNMVDEIKYSFGNTSDTVVFSWRGSESEIYYGPDTSYGSSVIASPSTITPVDIPGPFYEATIGNLQPGTSYHYKIGQNGDDHVFTTAPKETDTFKVVSVSDTIASTCRIYQAQFNQLFEAQNPYFVIHSGDIAIANECGVPAVHQYFIDIQNLTSRAAFMPIWGNHEYGPATEDAPPGTPRDTLANYKGRVTLANPQTVPNDTVSKTSHPGCGEEISSSINTCRGEDWGWFKAGRVLFIGYPPPWPNAIIDWQQKVTPLMQQAQDDPSIDFIVTYGHYPLFSSTNWVASEGYNTVFSTLGDQFSPSGRPDGKYVLNSAGHRHGLEVFSSYHGVMHVVNGGGGQGLINFQTILPDSIFRIKHLGFSTLDYDAVNRELTFKLICGPSISSESGTCSPGSVLYTKVFTRSPQDPTPTSTPTPTPTPTPTEILTGTPTPTQPSLTQYIGNQGIETDLTGWEGKYGPSSFVTVTRSTEEAHSGIASIKVLGLSGASNLNSGFNDNSYWVPSLIAGKTYNGSVWVKPNAVGQQIILRLREWNGSSLVTDQKVTLTATSTNWQIINANLKAAQAGTRLTFIIYANDVDAGDFFYTDDLSLTSAN